MLLIWLILVPVLALGANVLAQVVAFRMRGCRDPWGSIVTGVSVGMIVAVSGSAWLIGPEQLTRDALARVAMNLVSYTALAYGYFAFFNLHLTSLRIRLLREMLRHDRGLTRDEILTLYSADEALDLRVARLTQKGQLVEQNGRFRVEGVPLFLLMANLLDALKWLLLRRESRRMLPGSNH